MIGIAERAGLTKSTFFRHFPDKREVLFGGDTMTGLLAEGSPRHRPMPPRSKRWPTPWRRSGGRRSHPTAANSAPAGGR
ncbi:helix-turn-helix domain-containing protein [Streptomyces sp. NBC_01506]|uniref:helix-turn-helix domain-containing protein n=1 Tax=Streptomyces sp. NBC_01506 TaxID=2903887 RepID=UPI00387089E9